MTKEQKKQGLRRFIPSIEDVKKMRGIGYFASRMTDPMIWTFNRHSVSRATFFGIISAMIPFPVQVFSGIFFASYFRANLPVIIGWILTTNPLTIPFVFYASYKLGAWIMGVPISSGETVTVEWLWLHYKPILLGSAIIGLAVGTLGYFAVHFAWRRNIQKRWDERKARRLSKR